MDRMIYLAMSGAKQALTQQATVAHNLANLTTNGFRAETSVFRAVPVVGDGAPTRAFVVDSTPGADFTPGVIQSTGRDLDIAVQGSGWLAVQASDGSEAYTRNGSLQVNANGVLQTRNGNAVLGDGGPISIPNDTLVTVAGDGTVSTVPTGNRPAANSTIGRIKLVNPPEKSLERGSDGLFRVRGGAPAPADANVRVASGSLESSNVNAVDAMVNMITLARGFDMQMKMLQNAEANAGKATQLLTMQG
jgi:flagellar basal-body rod protein FlgF